MCRAPPMLRSAGIFRILAEHRYHHCHPERSEGSARVRVASREDPVPRGCGDRLRDGISLRAAAHRWRDRRKPCVRVTIGVWRSLALRRGPPETPSRSRLSHGRGTHAGPERADLSPTVMERCCSTGERLGRCVPESGDRSQQYRRAVGPVCARARRRTHPCNEHPPVPPHAPRAYASRCQAHAQT
jgi:hypothetical protein